MDVVLYVFAAILMLIGLSTMIRWIVYTFCNMKKECSLFYVINLTDKSAERTLRDAVERLSWYGVGSRDKVVATDSGLSEKMKKICRNICDGIGIELIEQSDLPEYIKGINANEQRFTNGEGNS